MTRGAERGSASVELLGMLPLLLLAALAAWQLLLVACTVTAAQDAARTGSRAAGLGANGAAQAVGALPAWLRPGASVSGGQRLEVRVRVPIVLPGFTTDSLTVRGTAELPGN